MRIQLPGSDEDQLVGTGSISKTYSTPQTVSNPEFASVYKMVSPNRVVHRAAFGEHESDRRPADHPLHTQWSRPLGGASLHTGRVVDRGGRRWDAGYLAQALKASCRVTLYGAMFDFDKASLRSGPTRAGTRSLCNESQPLATNRGTGPYRQRRRGRLQRQTIRGRATTVMRWLVAHGVPSSQLQCQGLWQGHSGRRQRHGYWTRKEPAR